MKEKDLNYWKSNAEEDYITTPISVLRYISELEKQLKLQTFCSCPIEQGIDYDFVDDTEYCINCGKEVIDLEVE